MPNSDLGRQKQTRPAASGAWRRARKRIDCARRDAEESFMPSRAKSEAKPSDARGKIVDALMQLASEQRFEEISIRDICKTADVSLAEFRDAFPSKGAVLAGLSRRIDRAVLTQDSSELADESPRERLFDILMRRLEAMAPYREGTARGDCLAQAQSSRRGCDEPGRSRLHALHARGCGNRD